MDHPRRTAFVTTRKGFCYLTIKSAGRNIDIKRVRNYAIEAQEKRDLRRLWPDVDFDWKKLAAQLVDKRLICRRYRARRRDGNAPARPRLDSFSAVFEPRTGTVYVDRMPSTIIGMGALLDAVLEADRIDKKRKELVRAMECADSTGAVDNDGSDDPPQD